MYLFIPELGENLTLIEDWRFKTICESRNLSLFDAFDVPDESRWHKSVHRNGFDVWNPKGPHEFEIPSGTVLKVDRVYIRKGAEDFSSITFIISISPDKRLVTKKFGGTASKTIRFWTKLKETRKMNIQETP